MDKIKYIEDKDEDNEKICNNKSFFIISPI